MQPMHEAQNSLASTLPAHEPSPSTLCPTPSPSRNSILSQPWGEGGLSGRRQPLTMRPGGAVKHFRQPPVVGHGGARGLLCYCFCTKNQAFPRKPPKSVRYFGTKGSILRKSGRFQRKNGSRFGNDPKSGRSEPALDAWLRVVPQPPDFGRNN